MVVGGLLVGSDDSDNGELELPDPRRRKFFNKNERVPPRCRIETPWGQWSLLLLLFAGLIILSLSVFSISGRIRHIDVRLTDISHVVSGIRILEEDVRRLRIELDLSRDSDPRFANETSKTTQYVHDVINLMLADIQEMKIRVEKTSQSAVDVTSRISTVEEHCLNVCRLAGSERERDKQRRRQAGKDLVFPDDDIVFKRTSN